MLSVAFRQPSRIITAKNSIMENQYSHEKLEEILARMEEITSLRLGIQPEHIILTNQQYMQLLGISERTAQVHRDEGLVSFSQVKSVIRYRLSDVFEMLENHRQPAYGPDKKSKKS